MDRSVGGTELGYGSGFVGNVNPNQPSISPQATYPVLTGSGQGDSGGVIQGLSPSSYAALNQALSSHDSTQYGTGCSGFASAPNQASGIGIYIYMGQKLQFLQRPRVSIQENREAIGHPLKRIPAKLSLVEVCAWAEAEGNSSVEEAIRA